MTTTGPGRPSKLTAATTAAICDVIAAGGTRSIAAHAAAIHPDTLNGWLRRAAKEATETPLEVDTTTTVHALRALAKVAQVPGYAKLRKADLATALAAKPSEYSVFSAALKRAEAEAQVKWLGEIARIGRGGHPETTVTEEYDAAGNLKTRTIRTTTSRAAWQAYAWLLERRHPADWSRRTELVMADDPAAKVDPLVGVHDELRLARLERQKQQGKSV